jgi:hypothetical protein
MAAEYGFLPLMKGTGMQKLAARGFALPTLKVLLAVVFAAGGVGWAGYSIVGGKNTQKKPTQRVVTTPMDEDGNEIDTNYTKAKSDKQVSAVSDQIASRIRDIGPAIQAIQAASGLAGGDDIADATINTLIPVISGDYDGFVDAIIAMGGKIANLDTESPVFTQLAKVFKHASVDVDRITVAKYEPPQGGMMMRRRAVEDNADAAPGDGPGFNMNESIMMMRTASLFPDAPSHSDSSAIEVRIPMKPKGEGESTFALILTWNAGARKWQPASYNVITRTMTVEDD